MISIMHDELHLCKAVAFELANRSALIALAWLVASVRQLFNIVDEFYFVLTYV